MLTLGVPDDDEEISPFRRETLVRYELSLGRDPALCCLMGNLPFCFTVCVPFGKPSGVAVR